MPFIPLMPRVPEGATPEERRSMYEAYLRELRQAMPWAAHLDDTLMAWWRALLAWLR